MPDFDIVTLINNPGGLDHEIIDNMSELIRKYPYFNTAYFLKAKALKNCNSEEYRSFLGLAATYSINRKKLYDFMNASYGEKIETYTQKFQVIKPDEEIADIIYPANETEDKEEIMEDFKQETKEIVEIPEKNNIIDYSKTTSTKELKNHIAETVKRQLSEAEEHANNDLKIIPDEYNLHTPISRTKREKKNEPEIIKHGYFLNDDLLELDENENIKNKEKPPVIADIKENNTSTQNLYDQTKLIDNFIHTNPRIVMKEENDYEYKDISESSIHEDDNLFTETLAKIYIKQGNFAKAVFAYEKLILKYPEKKAYFASQIENIKKKIND